MSEYEILEKKYRDRFDDIVPTFELRGYSENEIIVLIKKALENNEPINIKYSDDTLY